MKKFFIRDNQTTVGISHIAKIGLDKEALLCRFEGTVTDGEIETLVFARENREGMSELLKQELLVDYAKVTLGKRLREF